MKKLPNDSTTSLKNYLATISDPRDRSKCKHLLINILFIGICTLLCGGNGFSDMENVGEAKADWFAQFLDLSEGIPSHDTFQRVFEIIDPQQFNQCFVEWTQSLRQKIDAEIVAIDGKTLRGSAKNQQNPLHLVSAFATANGLVLGQEAVDEKSNEITAIPRLLRVLELAGCIVTIDAMGCQKNIAKEIIEADADYVLALKGNHETAYEEVKSFMDDAVRRGEMVGVEEVDKGHGRFEIRRHYLSSDIGWFADRTQWEGLKSVGMVESEVSRGGKVQIERRYYFSSLSGDKRAEFAKAVRTHWAIENSLHWVLDVTFGEDYCQIAHKVSAQNLASLRKLALNVLKQDSSFKGSIKAKCFRAACSNSYLANLLLF